MNNCKNQRVNNLKSDKVVIYVVLDAFWETEALRLLDFKGNVRDKSFCLGDLLKYALKECF